MEAVLAARDPVGENNRPLQIAQNGFVCSCAEKNSWTVELTIFRVQLSPGTALNRQLDLERVRVKTENMQHAVDHSKQKEQPTSDSLGEGAERSDALNGSVGRLLLQSDQVLVWRVVFRANLDRRSALLSVGVHCVGTSFRAGPGIAASGG